MLMLTSTVMLSVTDNKRADAQQEGAKETIRVKE
jgi:hypothetical protein